MDVVILCGGLGTRVQSISEDNPKSLIKIKNNPFINIILDHFQENLEIGKFILAAGYRGDKFFDQDFKNNNIKIVIEKNPLGTGGAVLNCLEFIDSDWFFVVNGDSLILEDVKAFSKKVFESKNMSGILLREVEDGKRFGSVSVSNERVIDFQEKIDNPNNIVNAGIYLFNKSYLEAKNFPSECSMEIDVLPSLIEDGIYAYKSNEVYYDIGTIESYEESTKRYNQ